MKRFVSLLATLATSCMHPDVQLGPHADLLPKDQIAIHLHPNGAEVVDIPAILQVASMIRIQAPADAIDWVTHLVKSAPSEARFLIILHESTPLEFVDRFQGDARVAAWELENEPEGFKSWTPKRYVDWVKTVAPEVRRRSPDTKLVSCATRPMTQNWPHNRDWNRRMIELGGLDGLDVFAVHIYGDDYWEAGNVAAVASEARKHVSEVWVTEFGVEHVSQHLSYFRKTPAAYEQFGFLAERWVWYDWKSPDGYALVRHGGESPLLQALKSR